MAPNQRARIATEKLFTNAAGEKAVRLALIAEDGRDLGGWGFDPVLKAIEAAIAESEAAERSFPFMAADLHRIMPNLPAEKRDLYLPHLVAAMAKYEINTALRVSAFLAQVSHESGEFRWLQEIWGPTDQQKKYEPPSDLAKKLGNTEKGDGYRYRGRGVIMITGRFNFRKYGDLLGVDLEGNPDLAAKPEYAFQIAALYWKLNKCNEHADQRNFKALTRAINGGLNGLADRERYYEIAKKALGVEE
jgi:putative chitinase